MRTTKTLAFIGVLCFCLLHKSSATFDLSNVDLTKFQYFKQSVEAQMKANAQSTLQLLQPVTDEFQKAKAVVVYFKNVLLGNPEHTKEHVLEFDPQFGRAWQPHFEQHFGPKGQHLIDVLGRGYSAKHLQDYGAIGREVDEY